MNRATRATLLSGLVFPGSGHFYLKKHFLAVVLVAGSAISTYVLVSSAVDAAMDVARQIETGEAGLDVGALDESVFKRSRSVERTTSVATNVLLLLWIIGMVDSYRVGTAQDRAARLGRESGS